MPLSMCITQVVNDTSSRIQRSSAPVAQDIPFQEMTSHCEALSMGKHHKMSVLMSFKNNQQAPSNQMNHVEAVHTSSNQVPNHQCELT
jgi:hypothetical protein